MEFGPLIKPEGLSQFDEAFWDEHVAPLADSGYLVAPDAFAVQMLLALLSDHRELAARAAADMEWHLLRGEQYKRCQRLAAKLGIGLPAETGIN